MRFLFIPVLIIARLIRFIVETEAYNGKHRIYEVGMLAGKTVPVTYHPQDCVWQHASVPDKELWRERMLALQYTPDSVFWMPVNDLLARREAQWQDFLAYLMRNWQWTHYEIKDWPTAWQNDVRIAGSDLPPRAPREIDRGELLWT